MPSSPAGAGAGAGEVEVGDAICFLSAWLLLVQSKLETVESWQREKKKKETEKTSQLAVSRGPSGRVSYPPAPPPFPLYIPPLQHQQVYTDASFLC